MSEKSSLLEKVKKITDLRDAIKMVKALAASEKVKKAEKPESQKGPVELVRTLKHLGIRELAPGLTTHIIGSNHPDMHRYHADVDLAAMHKGHPHVHVSCVDNSGMILSKCSKVHSSMKEAVKSIINHLHKGEWC
jgi:hypothetical protein